MADYKGEARTVSFWLSQEEIDRLDEEARKGQKTRNRLVREAIRARVGLDSTF